MAGRKLLVSEVGCSACTSVVFYNPVRELEEVKRSIPLALPVTCSRPKSLFINSPNVFTDYPVDET